MRAEFTDILPDDVLVGVAFQPEMLNDLYTISKLSQETVSSLVSRLDEQTGLPDQKTMESLVSQCLTPAEISSSLSAIIRTLMNLEKSRLSSIFDKFERWRVGTPERSNIFDQATVDQLRSNLMALVADQACILLMRKANKLLRDVGNEFRDVAVFCDLRPVFDEPRKQVEGFVLVANLRLHYVSQTGDMNVCEVAMTEDELRMLVTKSNEALNKLDVLKKIQSQRLQVDQ